jgi:hypothetical protein
MSAALHQEVYKSYFEDPAFKVDRFHELAKKKLIPAGMVAQCLEKRRFGFFELSLGYLPYTYIIYAPHIFGSVVRPWIWIPYYVRFDVYIYISMGI